jgi:lactate dehydrogenase-like 2-hydroxyacid dehydrogenase
VLAVTRIPALYMEGLVCRYEVLDRLQDTDPAAFAAKAPHIRAVAASGESRLPAELVSRLPALEIVSVNGVGYDGIDVAACKARGAVVTHTPDVLNDDVADLAIGLMLAAARQLPAADRYVRAGDWAAKGPMPLARKMSGARVGIVGMGRIGKAIATRAQAFDMRIAYTARTAKTDLPYRFFPTAVALAAEVDFLVVITPGGAGTKHMINAAVLEALGKKGILVNVARGSVVDEDALVEALEKGVIAGAGLDVFANEPDVPDRLKALPHVVLVPHIGSATTSTRQAMADLALGNLEAFFAGKPLLSPVPECR